MKQHVVKFFQFLEDKEGKNAPLKTKLLNPDKFKIAKDDLSVKGALDLSNSNITSLPNDLQVGWDLYLNNCTLLKSLPNGLQVGDDLRLEGCTSLKTLPNGIQVGLNLNLIGCTSLTSLPNGLQVGWDLILKNTPLAKMYSVDEIRAMIESKGGYVKKNIYI